ncbi:MAG: TniB family NTP-binding protein [Sedimenticola sp.]
MEKCKANYDKMTMQEKMKLVGDLYVKRDIGELIHRCFNVCRQEAGFLPEPEGVVVVGDTGTGKTSLLNNYLKENAPERYDGIIRRPFLVTSIPPKASMNSLATMMLTDLGDPAPHAGNIQQKSDRVRHLLKLQQVELVAFDEFQHLVEAIGRDGLARVSDWIKDQMKRTGIPFVIVGLKHAEKVVEVNEQLARLCPYRISLGPFGWESNSRRLDFRTFLARLDEMLPFDERSKMGDPDLAIRIFAATEGKLYRIAMLIKAAAFSALRRGGSCIELSDLSGAYDTKIGIMNGGLVNPFLLETKALEQFLIKQVSGGSKAA